MKRSTIAIIAVTLSFAVPAAAFACGNPVRIAGSKAVREIRSAEKLLKQGKYDKLRHYTYQHDFRDPALQQRAELIQATAGVRSRFRSGPGNLSSQVAELRRIFEALPDRPVVQARLAEALLLDEADGSAAEGAKLIEDLASRDLIGESEGWMAAATARDRAGDVAGRDAALESCRKIALRTRVAACRVFGK